MPQPDDDPGPNYARRFALYNRMFDEGHWARLTRSEKALWPALFRFADPNNETYVSVKRLAKDIKVNPANVSKTLKKLQDHGYLVNVGPRPGPGHSQTRRLTLPLMATSAISMTTVNTAEHMAVSAMCSAVFTADAIDTKQMALSCGTHGATTPERMAPGAIPTEGTDSNRTSTADAGASQEEEPEDARRRGVVDELTAIGVTGNMLWKLADIPDIYPAAVRVLRHRKLTTASNPAGLMVRMLQSGEHRTVDPLPVKTVAEMISSREIIAVAGYTVRPAFFTYNQHLNIFNEVVTDRSNPPANKVTVRAECLTAESMRLSPPTSARKRLGR